MVTLANLRFTFFDGLPLSRRFRLNVTLVYVEVEIICVLSNACY